MEKLIGESLPDLELATNGDQKISIPTDIMGKWTVLYFYPKDDTPGCTKQACGYRDVKSELNDINAQVIGVSSDSVASHGDFVSKFELNFALIADTDKQLRSFLEVSSRDSFLIDPEGKIRKIWRKVDPVASVDQTISAIKSLS